MSLFEFVTVMVSMILALTFSQLLMSVTYLVKQRSKVVPYAPYYIWLATLFLTLVNHWWSLWDLRDIDWDYLAFLYTLAGPTLVYFAVGLLAQDRRVSGVIDLPERFEDVRRLFMLIQIGYVTALWFDGPLLAGQDALGSIGIMHIPIVAAYLMAFLNTRKAVQVASPLIVIAVLCVIMTIRALA